MFSNTAFLRLIPFCLQQEVLCCLCWVKSSYLRGDSIVKIMMIASSTGSTEASFAAFTTSALKKVVSGNKERYEKNARV